MVKDKPSAIPEQNLHAVRALADKHEEMALVKIHRPMGLHDSCQAIMPAPHINGLGRQIDPCGLAPAWRTPHA